jgi:hypothetical protein
LAEFLDRLTRAYRSLAAIRDPDILDDGRRLAYVKSYAIFLSRL